MKSALWLVSASWLLGVGLLAVAVSPRAHATVRVVQFGGSFGFSYSPSFFTATVGDTVRWQGDFGFHPLSSTAVPIGAASFQNGTGTSFDYIITVAGTYSYQCDVHGPAMAGSFTAALTGVSSDGGSDEVTSFSLAQNYPNPFNPSTTIAFTLPAQSEVTLRIFDVMGREVALLVQGPQPAGTYRAVWEGATNAGTPAASGLYFYRLEAGSFVKTERMMLLK
jgi:plastocyanin